MHKVKYANTIFICILLVVLVDSPAGSTTLSLEYRNILPIVFNNSIPVFCTPSESPGFNNCVMHNGVIFSSVGVSNQWTEVIGRKWQLSNFDLGMALYAAPNLSQFHSAHDADGIFFGVSNNYMQIGGYIQMLDYFSNDYREDCHLVGRFDYDNGIFRGKYDQYDNCGSNGYNAYILSAFDKNDLTALVLMRVQVDPEDTGFVDEAFNSFYVIVH